MPVYLPPISRRSFLKGSLTAVAALGLHPHSALALDKANDGGVALLSDIHIAANPREVARSVNMTDHLNAVIKEVLAWPQPPGTLFINGDLAFNAGTAPDYGAVLKLLQPLRDAGFPIHLGLGNHDNRETFWKAMAAEKSVQAGLPGRQVAIVRTGPANWFLMDSLIKTLTTPGKLGPEQLAWLGAALDANADKPAIVMIHHQPGPLAPGKPGNGLQDENELFAVLRPRKQVKAYIFGHTHRWNVSRDESGIHLINLPPTAYVFEEGQPSGWVYTTVKDDGMRLELRCLDRQHKDHGQIHDLKWRAA